MASSETPLLPCSRCLCSSSELLCNSTDISEASECWSSTPLCPDRSDKWFVQLCQIMKTKHSGGLQNRKPQRGCNNVRSCNPQDWLSQMPSRGENKRHCLKLIQGGWINALQKQQQQAISLNAAGTPRWREIKQVFMRTEPSLLTLPGRISQIGCSLFSN